MEVISKPIIRFRWKGSGCNDPAGFCITIPLSIADSSQSNVTIVRLYDKIVLFPKNDDNGITSDGYFPVSNLNNQLVGNILIKPGIYKAHFDSSSSKYNFVILDELN